MQIKGDLVLQVEEVSIEVIKPSLPTASHLKTHKFSLLDQYYGHGYLSVPLFYSSPTNTNPSQILTSLKTSLSKALTLFYPLAGRIKDDYHVECNDEGVKFVHAQVRHCTLSQALSPPGDHLSQLFPKEHTKEAELLGIQVSFFRCGGIAIGVYLSHKIMDACSVCTFMLRWAKIASCGVVYEDAMSSLMELQPRFDSAFVFPPTKVTPVASEQIELTTERVVFKVFRFEGSEIAALKAKAKSSANGKYPSKMMAVTAFLWTIFSAMNKQRRTRLAVAASLRGRLTTDQTSLEAILPIMPKNTMGNSAVILLTPTMAPQSNLETLPDLVNVVEDAVGGIVRIDGEISKVMESFFEAVVESNDEGELGVYEVSSWLRLPFYEADFGWGKPVWFVALIEAFKNVITYLETRCGEGVEVMVWMTEEDMALFESVPELLEFASPVLSAA